MSLYMKNEHILSWLLTLKFPFLPVVVPHVIVHDFIEAVTDVVTPEHVHGTLGVKICNNQSIDNDYPYLSINQ